MADCNCPSVTSRLESWFRTNWCTWDFTEFLKKNTFVPVVEGEGRKETPSKVFNSWSFISLILASGNLKQELVMRGKLRVRNPAWTRQFVLRLTTWMRVVQWNQVLLWWDVCCQDRCLTLCEAVLHVQRHQGVSGRAVRGSRGKQLNLSSRSSAMASSLRILGYIYCNCVLGFARGCWACVLRSPHTSTQALPSHGLVWEESKALCPLPSPECQGVFSELVGSALLSLASLQVHCS